MQILSDILFQYTSNYNQFDNVLPCVCGRVYIFIFRHSARVLIASKHMFQWPSRLTGLVGKPGVGGSIPGEDIYFQFKIVVYFPFAKARMVFDQ